MPEEELTLTMRPPPASAMRGAKARMRRIDAITCRFHWACQSSSVSSSRARALLVPALLTSAHGVCEQALEQPLGRIGVRQVELHVGAVAGHGQDASAFLGEHARGGGAEAARASRDDADLPLQTEVHRANVFA